MEFGNVRLRGGHESLENGADEAMSITLTEKAAKEVQRIIEEQKLEEGVVLRVGVTGGGCSGFSYALGFDKAFDEAADSRYEAHSTSWAGSTRPRRSNGPSPRLARQSDGFAK